MTGRKQHPPPETAATPIWSQFFFLNRVRSVEVPLESGGAQLTSTPLPATSNSCILPVSLMLLTEDSDTNNLYLMGFSSLFCFLLGSTATTVFYVIFESWGVQLKHYVGQNLKHWQNHRGNIDIYWKTIFSRCYSYSLY